jgi:hypothetical protein
MLAEWFRGPIPLYAALSLDVVGVRTSKFQVHLYKDQRPHRKHDLIYILT